MFWSYSVWKWRNLRFLANECPCICSTRVESVSAPECRDRTCITKRDPWRTWRRRGDGKHQTQLLLHHKWLDSAQNRKHFIITVWISWFSLNQRIFSIFSKHLSTRLLWINIINGLRNGSDFLQNTKMLIFSTLVLKIDGFWTNHPLILRFRPSKKYPTRRRTRNDEFRRKFSIHKSAIPL